MSIRLMAAAWELDIPASEKMVLLCLCDHASDTGVCWPSVPTIARKCSKGERTVQGAIKWLREHDFCSWDDTPGKPHRFTLNPRKICTPAETAPPQLSAEPPQKLRPTPAETAPKPSRTIKEPPKSISACKPDDLPLQVWADWKRVRKKPITPTVMAGMEREAAKLGWTVSQAITHAAENSWQGFKADWVKDKSNGKRNGGSTWEIGQELLAEIGGG